MKGGSDTPEKGGGEREVVTGEVSDSDGTFPLSAPEPRFPTPKLASEAAAEAKAKGLKEDLTLYLSCGDFGGMARHTITTRGGDGTETEEITEEPCDHPSSFGVPGSRYGITPGKCFKHTEEKLAEKARRKACFLDAYCERPELGIDGAAEAIGLASPSTIYWWARYDKDFAENLQALVQLAEMVRSDKVEQVVLERILDPKSGADVLRMWYLKNRRPDRWKSDKGLGDGGDPGGGPRISGGQHVWLIGDQIKRWGGS